MPKIEVTVIKLEDNSKVRTFRIPTGVLKVASKFIPQNVASGLKQQGIEVTDIIELAESGKVHGLVAEIDDHRKGERLVVSVSD